MDTTDSERDFEQKIVELFNEKFDNLTADKSNYGDVIEILAAVIHSEKVQKIVNDKYLEHKGYDLEELAENGKEFFAEMVEKAKANEKQKSSGEPLPINARVSAVEYDLVQHLYRQKEFSKKAFGPGVRTKGVLDHIRKEMQEIREKPFDLEEWIDVVMLALDGALRAGYFPREVAEALEQKLAKNEERDWPDWKDADPDKAIEHL